MLARFTGTVMKFDCNRGFGFVKVDGPFPDALIHISQFGAHVGAHDIGCGVRVEFYLENHAKGLRANRVDIITSDADALSASSLMA